MEHVLLTGATGFLGSHLLEALLGEGYRVTILKRESSDTSRIGHLLGRVTIVDIDKISLDRIFHGRDIDVIIHLATLYKKYDDAVELEEMMYANVTFPAILLAIGIKSGVRSFINTGTFFEYKATTSSLAETNLVDPLNTYARTKITFEAYLHSCSREVNALTLKVFSPYGPKDNNKIIPHIINSQIKKSKVALSEGLQKLDFTYCGDVVSAYLKAIAYVRDKENVDETFNIGSGVPTSIREIVSLVEEISGSPLNVEWGESSPDNLPLVYANNDKAKRYLDWQPKVGIRDGLEKTIGYYRGMNEHTED